MIWERRRSKNSPLQEQSASTSALPAMTQEAHSHPWTPTGPPRTSSPLINYSLSKPQTKVFLKSSILGTQKNIVN